MGLKWGKESRKVGGHGWRMEEMERARSHRPGVGADSQR